MKRIPITLAFTLTLFSTACSRKTGDITQPSTDAQSGIDTSDYPNPSPWTPRETGLRMVAIGDVHGDIAAARLALGLAGAIDSKDNWIGNDLIVVQTGDQLDRGDEDKQVCDLFQRLAVQATTAGGQVISLNGNHEVMNVEGWLDYVSDGAWETFEGLPDLDLDQPWLGAFPEFQRARAAAFHPGGPYAQVLATRNIVEQVGDTVFVHGGVLPDHLAYGLGQINEEVKSWMRGETAQPSYLSQSEAPIWSQHYATATINCSMLQSVLDVLSAKRMVIGHTIQSNGITSACAEQVWRIDVGMSNFYTGNTVEVLEIAGDQVRVLKASFFYPKVVALFIPEFWPQPVAREPRPVGSATSETKLGTKFRLATY